MCFILNSLSEKKIASRDIVCWKVLTNNNQPPFTWVHNCFIPYLKNKLSVKIILLISTSHLTVNRYIDEGYHSYKLKKYANKEYVAHCSEDVEISQLKVCKFIIPKGTVYYDNEREYVSETIKML